MSAPPGMTFFRNKSGETIPAHSIVVLNPVSGDSLTDVGGEYHVDGVKPSATFRRYIGVTPACDIPNNRVAPCYTSGEAVVKWAETYTPHNGEMYGVAPGSWEAARAFPGLTVLGQVNLANRLMRVRIEPIVMMLGRADGDCAAETATTSYTIVVNNTGATLGDEDDSGYTTVPNAYFGALIKDQKTFLLLWIGSNWEGTPRVCNFT